MWIESLGYSSLQFKSIVLVLWGRIVLHSFENKSKNNVFTIGQNFRRPYFRNDKELKGTTAPNPYLTQGQSVKKIWMRISDPLVPPLGDILRKCLLKSIALVCRKIAKDSKTATLFSFIIFSSWNKWFCQQIFKVRQLDLIFSSEEYWNFTTSLHGRA